MRTALLSVASSLALAAAKLSQPKFPLATADGYYVRSIVTNVISPRTLVFDTNGHLLVLQQGTGILAYTLADDGSIRSSHVVQQDRSFNHGLTLSRDGRTLYASSQDIVWSWNYDPSSFALSDQRTLVRGMASGGHTSRTILISRKHPNLLLISKGSDGNIDEASFDPSVGRAAIKAFDLDSVPDGGHDYASTGTLVAYGVRNEVGITEDDSGGIWGVENSADDITRTLSGVTTDVHSDNPGEKLHSFGDAANSWPVSNATATASKFYGYPYCLSVYNPSQFPQSDSFQVGDFFVTAPNATLDDSFCNRAIKPRLLFQAHSAPLDVKFGRNNDKNNAYVALHGSWNRDPPTGYKVVVVPGSVTGDGAWSPSAELTNPHGYTDLLTNENPLERCPDVCFRPTALAWNADGTKLYVASDRTNEIVVVIRGDDPGAATRVGATSAFVLSAVMAAVVGMLM